MNQEQEIIHWARSFGAPRVTFDRKYIRFGKNNKYSLRGDCWDYGGKRYYSATLWDFPADTKTRYTPKGQAEMPKELIRIIELEDQKQAEDHLLVAEVIEAEVKQLSPATGLEPYLVKKQIAPRSALADKGTLFLPLQDVHGKIWSWQTISPGGKKYYHSNARKKGCFHVIQGKLGQSKECYIGEGFATMSSFIDLQLPNKPDALVVAAMDAYNLTNVAIELRQAYPDLTITMVADQDESQVGEKKAKQAAAEAQGAVVLPPAGYKDWNDLAVAKQKTIAAPVTVPVNVEVIDVKLPMGEALDPLIPALASQIFFDDSSQCWFSYKGTHWAEMSEAAVNSFIDQFLKKRASQGYNWSKVTQAYSFIKSRLLKDASNYWSNKNVMPFKNGLLDLGSMKLVPSTPENVLNWVLPYDYNPEAKCPKYQQFIKTTCNDDWNTIGAIETFLAALLRGRSDIQRYLDIVGMPGTGKSTLQNLACDLVGKENIATTTFSNLANNRFETSNFRNKRLIIFTDSLARGQGADVFKALTGEDPIAFERKNKDPGQPFVFKGLVIVVANRPIIFDDQSTALMRRRIPIRLDHVLDPKVKNVKLSKELAEEVPGIVNHLLSITNEAIDQNMAEMDEMLGQNLMRSLFESNTVAEFLKECCVHAPGNVIQLGNYPQPHESKIHTDGHLYPAYFYFCKNQGLNPLAIKNFKLSLIELATKYSRPVFIKKIRGSKTIVEGIRIKPADDESRVSFFDQ